MANFATPEDVEAFLQRPFQSGEEVLAAERALTEATAAIRNYCRQYLELVEDEEITLDSKGGSWLFLPQLPVVDVSEVIEDDVTLTPDDDYILGQHGKLYRVGQTWCKGVQNITITYSHGYETLPDDIVAVCTRAASRAFQAGLRAVETDAVPGVASKSLGDFSVSYASDTAVEGMMGASGARMLLMSEKDVLDAYRIKGP